jgi:hypothetical protein
VAADAFVAVDRYRVEGRALAAGALSPDPGPDPDGDEIALLLAAGAPAVLLVPMTNATVRRIRVQRALAWRPLDCTSCCDASPGACDDAGPVEG